jgi:hypothetical protein
MITYVNTDDGLLQLGNHLFASKPVISGFSKSKIRVIPMEAKRLSGYKRLGFIF